MVGYCIGAFVGAYLGDVDTEVDDTNSVDKK